MMWKALGWMVLASSSTKIKLKCYCTGLFEECLLKKQILAQIKPDFPQV